MRLFIGITFEDDILNKLQNTIDSIRKISKEGNFTTKERLHLTLIFLGEVADSKLVSIEESIDSIDMEPFYIETNNIGLFKRRWGDICWIGFKESAPLQELYNKLFHKLRQNGFSLDNRPYTPHVTLGRKVVLSKKRDLKSLSLEIPKLLVKVSKISLIKSHHVDGKLTYTPIMTRTLDKSN